MNPLIFWERAKNQEQAMDFLSKRVHMAYGLKYAYLTTGKNHVAQDNL